MFEVVTVSLPRNRKVACLPFLAAEPAAIASLAGCVFTCRRMFLAEQKGASAMGKALSGFR